MQPFLRSLPVLAFVIGCNTYVPCESTTTGITPTERTPLGFSPADVASALALDETVTLNDAEGTPTEVRVTAEVILLEDPGGSGRPPIPSFTTLRPADGMEHPGSCEGVEVRVGDIEVRVATSDGRIDQAWRFALNLTEPLPATVSFVHFDFEMLGGTWRPSMGYAVFEVSFGVTDGSARLNHLRVLARVATSPKTEVDEPFLTYDAP